MWIVFPPTDHHEFKMRERKTHATHLDKVVQIIRLADKKVHAGGEIRSSHAVILPHPLV